MKQYREFEGGYVVTKEADALLAARKNKQVKKKELRIFFAKLLSENAKGRINPDIILNGESPSRRFTSGEQEKAEANLLSALQEHPQERELSTKVPKRIARLAARGLLTTGQMTAALFYYRWRKPQRRRRTLVQRGERYASFTLDEASAVTGMARSSLCKAFQGLRRIRAIAVAWRPMGQIKRYGMLFVDGSALNLYCKKSERYRGSNPHRRLQETRTQGTGNAYANRLTLPRNSITSSRSTKETLGQILERLRLKASQMSC